MPTDISIPDYFKVYPESTAGVYTYNTRPASPAFIDAEVLGETFDIDVGHEQVRTLDSPRLPTAIRKRGKTVPGQINIECIPDQVLELLLATFGKVTKSQPDAVGAPNTFQHAYVSLKSRTITFPSVGVDMGIEATTEKRVGGIIVDSLQFEHVESKEAVLQFGCIGADLTKAAYPGTPTFAPVNVNPVTKATIATIGAVNIDPESVRITYSNGFVMKHPNTSRTFKKARMGLASCEIALSFPYEIDSLFADLIAETEKAFRYKVEGDTIESTQKYTVDWNIPRVDIIKGTPQKTGQEIPEQSITLRAVKPTDTTEWVTLTTTDKVATPATYG